MFWIKTTVNKPSYNQGQNEDAVDLQVKSLEYAFKRLRINRLKSCQNSNELQYSDNYIVDPEMMVYFNKLDSTYNIQQLVSRFLTDEYKILCDYIKNKFRAYCILSELPSERPASPVKGNLTSIEYNGEKLPIIYDYKGRPASGFGFSVVTINGNSVDTFAEALAKSYIYFEHDIISLGLRRKIAKQVIEQVLGPQKIHTSHLSITKDQRAQIIDGYLKKIAFNVQVRRIYDEYMKQKKATSPIKIQAPSLTPLAFPSPIPTSSLPSSSSSLSLSTISNRKSISDLTKTETPNMIPPYSERSSKSPSPTRKLTSKPSISKLKLDEVYNSNTPQACMRTSDTNSIVDTELWNKCKAAVKKQLTIENERLKSLQPTV